MARMVQIEDLIAELQAIRDRWGNTCVYVRDVSWGSKALWRQSEDEAAAKEYPGVCPACRMKCLTLNHRSRCCDEPTGGDGPASLAGSPVAGG